MKRILGPMFLVCQLAAVPALAQQEKAISIQLNTAEAVGDSCRMTFVIRNGIDRPVEALGLDLVMFDKSEGVSGYAAIDFGNLPAGKTRVRQYDVAKGDCTDISRVLLNEIRTCEIEGTASDGCLSMLDITSRAEIELIL